MNVPLALTAALTALGPLSGCGTTVRACPAPATPVEEVDCHALTETFKADFTRWSKPLGYAVESSECYHFDPTRHAMAAWYTDLLSQCRHFNRCGSNQRAFEDDHARYEALAARLRPLAAQWRAATKSERRALRAEAQRLLDANPAPSLKREAAIQRAREKTRLGDAVKGHVR